MASESELYSLVKGKEFAAALKLLHSFDDDKARRQLVYTSPHLYSEILSGTNALMLAAHQAAPTPEELIREMVKRGQHNYVNSESRGIFAHTAAMVVTRKSDATTLELLLTLGADPRGCRERIRRYLRAITIDTVLDRFEQRTTLACCLRHYDELHQESPLTIHPDIIALSPFAKILHDLHGINGDMHSISRLILSYI
jgi:hypothetical protein